MTDPSAVPSLDRQREAFVRRRFMAMPVAGAIAWTGIGIAGAFAPLVWKVWAVFIGTGVIFYLGIGVAKLLGEDLLGKDRSAPFFDRVFMLSVVSALCVFAVAIPFFRADPTSLPLSVGILTGLMWIPLSGLMGHWIGLFHGIARTVGVLAAWLLLPDARFVVIPAVIVAIYLVSIVVLQRRWVTVLPPSGG